MSAHKKRQAARPAFSCGKNPGLVLLGGLLGSVVRNAMAVTMAMTMAAGMVANDVVRGRLLGSSGLGSVGRIRGTSGEHRGDHQSKQFLHVGFRGLIEKSDIVRRVPPPELAVQRSALWSDNVGALAAVDRGLRRNPRRRRRFRNSTPSSGSGLRMSTSRAWCRNRSASIMHQNCAVAIFCEEDDEF